MMKVFISLLGAVFLMVTSPSFAQDSSGFSVGGTGKFEGKASGDFSSAGYSSVSDYVNAANLGYCDSSQCASDYNEALAADVPANAPNMITDGCGTYGTLNSQCSGSQCSGMQYGNFQPLLEFNRSNACLSPGYDNYADYQAAIANGKGYQITQGDRDNWDEAKAGTYSTQCSIQHGTNCDAINAIDYGLLKGYITACATAGYGDYSDCHTAFGNGYGRNPTGYAAWSAASADTTHEKFCVSVGSLSTSTSNPCGQITTNDYADAKSAYSDFQAAKAKAASGTLSWADLTNTYGGSSVSIPAPWNAAPNKGWLLAYLNETTNQSPAMNSADMPSDWQGLIDTVTSSSSNAVALWYLQQIADQVAGFPTTDMTADLLTAVGVASAITGNAAYITNGQGDVTNKSTATLPDTAAVTAWLYSIVPPTFADASAVTISKNVPDVSASGVVLLSGITATAANGTPTIAFVGSAPANISYDNGSISTTGAVSNGSYDLSLQATDSNNVVSTAKSITLVVNALPTISLTCGDGIETINYSCSTNGADADGDSLTYSLVNAPSWLSVGSDGTLTGTPNAVANNTGIKVRVSDGKTTADSAAFAINVTPNTAAVLADTSSTLSTSDVANLSTIGVSSAITNDLTSNNNCGPSGNQNCLAAFNAQKASSSCSLAGGNSASAAQLEAYIGCVMIEHHTANVASAALGGNTNITSGCSTSVNLPIPATCGHPQWTCTLQTAPSGWALNGVNLVVPANYSGAGSQTATVRMSLNIYNPAYTKDVTKTYNVAAAVLGAANGLKLFNNGSSENITTAQNACRNKGGRLATESEFTSISSHGQRLYHYSTADPDLTFGTACSNFPWKSKCTPGNTCRHPYASKYNQIQRKSGSSWNCEGLSSSQTWYYACADLPSCN